MPSHVARAYPVMVVNSLMLLGSQNGIQTGQLELPGGLPESIFKPNISKSCQILHGTSQEAFQTANSKVEIGNLLLDPRQELVSQEPPEGFPKSKFKGKIGNFHPDPDQNLPEGLAEVNKHKFGACWAAKASPPLVAAFWTPKWAPDWPT